MGKIENRGYFREREIEIVRVRLFASLHTSSMQDHIDIRPDPRSNLTIDGANDSDEFMRGRNSGLHQDKRPTHD